MSNLNNIHRPSTGKRWLVMGAILLLVGLIGVVVFAFPRPSDVVGGDPQIDGLWQAGVTIGSAVATGAGLTMLLIGLIKRRKLPPDDHGSRNAS
ncbi:MAG: hypothetical protein JWL94_2041 [Microbacteriaceae bacterium]|jgi:hypothetical protein|nr:hypothetical protein [Microbacteriaceae bacterium]